MHKIFLQSFYIYCYFYLEERSLFLRSLWIILTIKNKKIQSLLSLCSYISFFFNIQFTVKLFSLIHDFYLQCALALGTNDGE